MSNAADTSRIFGRVDIDRVGDRLELYLLHENIQSARTFQNELQAAMKWLRQALTQELGCDLLYSGCDDVLFQIDTANYNHAGVESLRQQFAGRTGCTLSYGFGHTIREAVNNLRVAKLSGRDRAIGNAPVAVSLPLEHVTA